MGAFDDLIPQKSSGAFSDLIPAQQVSPDSDLLSPRAQQELSPQQQQQLIEARERQLSVLPEDQRPIGPSAPVKRAQAFEQLRQENPALAAEIESLSPTEAAAIGFQQGLRTIARGASKPFGADAFPEVVSPEMKALQKTRGATQIGKIVGEAAPFAAAAPLTGTIGTGFQLTRGATLVPQITSTAGRAAVTGGLGAAEGAAIAAGEDKPAGEVALAAGLGGVIGAGAEVLPALRRGAGQQLPTSLVDEGEELLRRSPSSREVRGALDQSAPTIDQLRATSRQLFDEVDNAGITIAPNSYRGLTSRIRRTAEDAGLDAVNTPQANRAIQRMENLIDQGRVNFRELNQIRETAQVAAGNVQNRKEAAIGAQIIDSIDDFLGSLNNNMVRGGNVGNRIRTARELWGRARRSEMIEGAMTRARDQASGFENGIRVQFRQILNNPKRSRFFNRDELAAMRQVVQGSRSANLFKFLGKFGLSENQATSMLGASIGAGGGAAIGSAIGGAGGAGVGAVLLPAIGQVSKGLAQRLTRNNAQFANRVIRAGRDADQIARAYLASTPRAQRSAEELSQLLMRNDVNLSNVTSDIAVEAAQLARRVRQQRTAATGAALATVPVAAEEE